MSQQLRWDILFLNASEMRCDDEMYAFISEYGQKTTGGTSSFSDKPVNKVSVSNISCSFESGIFFYSNNVSNFVKRITEMSTDIESSNLKGAIHCLVVSGFTC